MNKIAGITGMILLLFVSGAVHAQQTAIEQIDLMRSNGKIYVVVAVVVTILVGLFVYLFTLDRKISKLEKSYTAKK